MGVDKIQNKVSTGGDNLVVSFPYREGAIDKVDYNIQDNKFNLVISPRDGFPKLDPKEVEYTYTGGKIEFIITIDNPNLNSLGDIYSKNQREFDGKNIINIDRHLINNNYGTINMVVKSASSTTELVYKVIKTMNVELDKDMSTNLYAGIVAATNNFSSYSVNADTFQTAAELLRSGAVKKPYRPNIMQRPGMQGQTQQSQNAVGMGNFFPNPFGQKNPQAPMPMNRPQPEPVTTDDDMDMDVPMPMNQQAPQRMQPRQQDEIPQPIQSQRSLDDVEKQPSQPVYTGYLSQICIYQIFSSWSSSPGPQLDWHYGFGRIQSDRDL